MALRPRRTKSKWAFGGQLLHLLPICHAAPHLEPISSMVLGLRKEMIRNSNFGPAVLFNFHLSNIGTASQYQEAILGRSNAYPRDVANALCHPYPHYADGLRYFWLSIATSVDAFILMLITFRRCHGTQQNNVILRSCAMLLSVLMWFGSRWGSTDCRKCTYSERELGIKYIEAAGCRLKCLNFSGKFLHPSLFIFSSLYCKVQLLRED